MHQLWVLHVSACMRGRRPHLSLLTTLSPIDWTSLITYSVFEGVQISSRAT